MVTLVWFFCCWVLFSLRLLELKMLELGDLNITDHDSKLLSVSSPVTSPSDVFYTVVAENITLKERFFPPAFFFYLHTPLLL